MPTVYVVLGIATRKHPRNIGMCGTGLCFNVAQIVHIQKIISMRNRLVHGYFEVNLERVWETVQKDIPLLISQLEPRIPPEAE